MTAIRRGARLLQELRRLVDWRRSPAPGRSFWVWARYCGVTAIRRGARLLHGRRLEEGENEKGDPKVAFFEESPELSSGFPSEHGSDHRWWSGRCFQRLACYAVPSSRLSRPRRLST